MTVVDSFLTKAERELSEDFLANGYVIRDVDDQSALDAIRAEIVGQICQQLRRDMPNEHGEFLNNIHKIVEPEKLNELRLAVYRNMNGNLWFRPTYYALGRRSIDSLVGNELAMQNRVNLSIQMPNDDSSLLDIHADVFGGETPFQIVQWLPLVDCRDTKSMFILPYPKSERASKNLSRVGDGGMSELYASVEKDLVWLDIPYGKTLIFSPNCLHGNIVNRVPETRWSLNCRFTGLFTPYASPEKKIGSFYLPITTRPVSLVGMRYEQPGGFEE
ncbi:MAG TPA: sporadic carbohydrate cluster 2OG-Fe(II) oxygenase [Alphaproteobacteria bacterium]|nr:sporadic carbohydrate cluster 2OG-Fe(II) oxygenase [Alphaproteobacteria bacterium]